MRDRRVLFRDLAVDQRFGPAADFFPYLKTSPRGWLHVNGAAGIFDTVRFLVEPGPMNSAAAASAAASQWFKTHPRTA